MVGFFLGGILMRDLGAGTMVFLATGRGVPRLHQHAVFWAFDFHVPPKAAEIFRFFSL